jgi:hypothetical protein
MSADPGYSVVRRGTCAVGYTTDPVADQKTFEVLGTGFVVGPHRHVITCAHVLQELEAIFKKKGPRPRFASLQFVLPLPNEAGWITAFRGWRTLETLEDADLAILQVVDLPQALVSAPIVTGNYVPHVGEEIGVCGYAHGSALLRKGKEATRFGPIVQRGIVAAQSPFDVATPDVVLLDVIAGPAASGSPVFRAATGEVCGVLFEGQVNRSAALSAARLIHVDDHGELAARWSRVREAGSRVVSPPRITGGR